MFDTLIHADWSANAKKRWLASAVKIRGQWHVSTPEKVPSPDTFLNNALAEGSTGKRVLIGFDFPIGVPIEYAAHTGSKDFKTAIASFGEGKWSSFWSVANDPNDVSVFRPFYPNKSSKGATRSTLVEKLCVPTFANLLRECEKKSDKRSAACSLFWTLGGNQVGKAAISGWREFVCPAIAKGARLWPFDGTLTELSRTPGVVIAETYPGEAYHHVGIVFRRDESKRRQSDRQSKSTAIFEWATRNDVSLDHEAQASVDSGFGSTRTGEDEFDSFAGLLSMIEVVERRRSESSLDRLGIRKWEGWILGQVS